MSHDSKYGVLYIILENCILQKGILTVEAWHWGKGLCTWISHYCYFHGRNDFHLYANATFGLLISSQNVCKIVNHVSLMWASCGAFGNMSTKYLNICYYKHEHMAWIYGH